MLAKRWAGLAGAEEKIAQLQAEGSRKPQGRNGRSWATGFGQIVGRTLTVASHVDSESDRIAGPCHRKQPGQLAQRVSWNWSLAEASDATCRSTADGLVSLYT